MTAGKLIFRGAAWLAAPVALALTAGPALALTLAPALVIFALLAAGVRPGEAALLRLGRRRPARAFGRPAAMARPRLPFVVGLVDRLLASSIAVRPPPAVAATLR